MIRLLAAVLVLGAIHHAAGTPGLILTAVAVLAYLLLRTRPFTTCARCRGHGSRTRILGAPVPCRRCNATGLGTRADRRKAPLMPPRNRGGGR